MSTKMALAQAGPDNLKTFIVPGDYGIGKNSLFVHFNTQETPFLPPSSLIFKYGGSTRAKKIAHRSPL